MHPLIHAFCEEHAAGIFDMDETSLQGRFEWHPSFRASNKNATLVLDGFGNTRYLPFDAHSELPFPFHDYLPGSFSKRLLGEALRNAGRTVESLSSLSWLSLTGDRGMGAFRFEPAGYPELNAVETVDLDRLVRWAALIHQGRGSEVSERRLRELLRCGLFTKGSAPKILVAINDFTGEVLSGQGQIPAGFDAWIMKLDGVVAGSAEKLAEEYRYYKKAEACSIQVATCRMLRDGHWKHLMVKRFDRVDGKKRMFATCPSDIDSWEGVFRLMRAFRLPYPDMDELFRRMVFSILTNNPSYGTSKICFTYSNQEWRLAPAFHLNPSMGQMEHQLSLNGKRSNWSLDELSAFGKSQNIRKAPKILEQLSAILL